ncbi:Uncharacterised protein [uncultured archaeon]|nr:Uncharacterised protein [uncultured archaeon]
MHVKKVAHSSEAEAMILNPQKYRVAFVFNTLYYPFTYPEILNSLVARKYAIIAGPPPRPVLSGARIYVSGFVASKPGCFIELDDSRKIIATEGSSIDSVLASARDIVDISMADFRLNLPEGIDYTELIGAVVVPDSRNPTAMVGKFSGEQYNAFNEILGTETAGYSIRIVPKDRLSMEKNWFDISITPRFSTADREYYVEVVFRREKNIDDVLDFTAQLETKLFAIMDKIRGS